MAFDQRNLDDYVDVAERIAEFKAAFPDGSLRCVQWGLKQAEGWEKGAAAPTQQTFVYYQAVAYRHPDDMAPGMGTAWEVFPGRTPYTRGSELMNAETSAWGRALAALGIATKRGIASREEVRNRQAERDGSIDVGPISAGIWRGDGLPTNRDGSLSRSRTTDEEKAAAGVMTDAQQREHNRLAKPPEQHGNVTRLRSVDEDDPHLDYSQPADLNLTPEYAPGTIDSRQSKAMHAEFRRLGITDRDVRLKVCEGTLREAGLWTNLNHPQGLSTSNALSWHEADQLLKALREMKP